MPTTIVRKQSTLIVGIAISLGISAIWACRAGDHFVSGVGNGGNKIYANQVLDEVIDVLAASKAIPTITDETLLKGFESIQRRALDGDPESVLIVFQVAERQRSRKE